MVNQEEFKETVLNNPGLVMVQFFADWSGTCQMMAPIFEQIAGSYNSMTKFLSVDVEENPGLQEEYMVMELPTILFFRKGELVDHVAGLVSRNALIAKLENNLSH